VTVGGLSAWRRGAQTPGVGDQREYVGAVWKMESCDYRWVAARNQRSATDGPGPKGSEYGVCRRVAAGSRASRGR
jgi:hypothetical protein